MPAYAFEKLLNLVGDEFDMEFKSLQDLYTEQEGDPVEKLRMLAQQERVNNPSTILKGSGQTNMLAPGRMYMFQYDPVNKKKLDYWDKFPVGIIMNVNKKKGYFSMINFHYLPPVFRAEMMDAMYPFVEFPQIESQDDITQSMRTHVDTNRIDFDFMRKRLNMTGVFPAWKRYRIKNVIGNYLYIPPIGWDTIIMLPVEKFQGSSINRIWNDSRQKRKREAAKRQG